MTLYPSIRGADRLHKITKVNINPKFEFFRKVCIEECIDYLGDSIPTVKKINIIENTDKNMKLLEDTGGALCTIKYNKDKIFCEIHISENILEYYSKKFPGERDRREKFLKSINVPVNKYSLFLIVLLHELGHGYLIKLFYDAGLMNDYNIFDSLSESLSDIFEKRVESLLLWELHHNNNELPQLVNGIESQCDIFARDNFLPIWKRINKIINKYTLNE
jgi:hypothetical protein